MSGPEDGVLFGPQDTGDKDAADLWGLFDFGGLGSPMVENNVIDPRLLAGNPVTPPESVPSSPHDGPADNTPDGQGASSSSTSGRGRQASGRSQPPPQQQQHQQQQYQLQYQQPRQQQQQPPARPPPRQDPVHRAPELGRMANYAEDESAFFDGTGYWFAARHGACPLNSRHRHDAWGGVLFLSAADAVAACAPSAPNQAAPDMDDDDWMALLMGWQGGGEPQVLEPNQLPWAGQ